MSDRTEPLDCVAAMRQLWDYLDGELGPERMEAVRTHLSVCARCYPHHDFERAFLDALAGTRSERAAPETVRRRVVAALRDAGFAPG
jgi:anti-sigma factor (TIGR02949 family)